MLHWILTICVGIFDEQPLDGKEQMMSRYVDAEYVKAVMLNDRLMQGNAEFTLYVQQVETQVNALPGIDIVRCSECKHWRTYETWAECELWTDDPYESAKTKANDFCSYGERRKP